MSDRTVSFLKTLKISKDIHGYFFSKQSSQTYFECEVQYNGQHIVPYRNNKCQRLECFYSGSELGSIYDTQANGASNYQFPCKICSTMIVLNQFVEDAILFKCMSEASKQNNKPNLRIEVHKDGTWKPTNSITYNQLSQITIADLNNAPSNKIIPDIANFTLDDYKRLLDLYTNNWSQKYQFMDRAFDCYGVSVKFSDVYEVTFNSEVSIELMRFLICYLSSQNLKDQHSWKIYFIGVSVASFDEVKQEGSFYYIDGLEQTLGYQDLSNWEYVALIVRFERVWTLLLYRTRDKYVYGLNYYHLGQMQLLSKYLISSILGQKSITLKLLPSFEIEKPDELMYSGNLLFIFFYNLLVEKDLSHMQSITKQGIRKIIKQTESLKWLVLKTTEQQLSQNPPTVRSQKSQKSNNSIVLRPPEERVSNRQPSEESFRQPSEKSYHSIRSKQQSSKVIASPVVIPYNTSSKQLIDYPVQSNRNSSQLVMQKSPTIQPIVQLSKQPSIVRQQPQIQYIQPPQQTQNYYQSPPPPIQAQRQLQQPLDEDDEPVALSKEELVQLLEKVRQNVLYEVQHPQEDLAKKYVDSIEQFNVRTDKLDQSLPNTLRNQSILLTGQEMYNILDKFKGDIRQQVTEDLKHGINYIDPEIEKQEAEKNFQQFQQILQYYYQYNPEMYKKLIDEYNHRFHNQLLEKMGLKEQLAPADKQQTKQHQQQHYPHQNRGSVANNHNNGRNSINNTNACGSMAQNQYPRGSMDYLKDYNNPDNGFRDSIDNSTHRSQQNSNSASYNRGSLDYNYSNRDSVRSNNNNRQQMIGSGGGNRNDNYRNSILNNASNVLNNQQSFNNSSRPNSYQGNNYNR